MSDETDASITKPDGSPKSTEKVLKEASPTVDSSDKVTSKTPTATKAVSEQSVFDVNICYDDNAELMYFSVEKQHQQDTSKYQLTGTSSDKSALSASGSVHSVTEPFTLPSRFSTLTANSSTLSSSSSEAHPVSITNPQTLEKSRQEVKGTVALCQFIIDHFEKVNITQ